MIFTANESSKGAQVSQIFKQRGLNLTQSKISDVAVFGKPKASQMAYGGYKSNLEAFLFATATKQRVVTTSESYIIPDLPVPEHFNYPQVVFQFSKVPTPETLKRITELLSNNGLKPVAGTKGPPTFTLDKPLGKHLAKSLPSLANQTCIRLERYAQLEGAHDIVKVYECLDLFLRTNTYAYRPVAQTVEGQSPEADREIGGLISLRVPGNYWRLGWNKDTPVSMVRRKGKDGAPIKITDDEPEDVSPHRPYAVSVDEAVFVAKPSPFPSGTNVGPPSGVPNRGGLVFPYFPGLLTADTPGLRHLATNHFSRCLVDQGEDPKQAYLRIRGTIGTVSNTPQGLELAHMLFGVEMALQTQSILYIMKDAGIYLGFCLLGEHFSVFAQGRWHDALTEGQLHDELKGILTQQQLFEEITDRLRRCCTADGDILSIPAGSPKGMAELATYLAKIKISEDDEDEMTRIKEMRDMIGRYIAPTPYLTMKPSHIAQTLDDIFHRRPVPPEASIFIPTSEWSGIDSMDYQHLARYGSTSFSLRNAKGPEISFVVDAKHPDEYEAKADNGSTPKYTRFIVTEKPVRLAESDLAALMKTKKLRFDITERAAGSRTHVIQWKDFAPIWKVLKESAADGLMGSTDVRPDTKGKKRAFGETGFDETLF